MRTEIDVTNSEGSIRPGMAGQVALILGKGPDNALRIPNKAVVFKMSPDGGKNIPAVYVFRNGKAILVPIQIEYASAREYEVATGLNPQDRVIADPAGLQDGDAVRPVEPKK